MTTQQETIEKVAGERLVERKRANDKIAEIRKLAKRRLQQLKDLSAFWNAFHDPAGPEAAGIRTGDTVFGADEANKALSDLRKALVTQREASEWLTKNGFAK